MSLLFYVLLDGKDMKTQYYIILYHELYFTNLYSKYNKIKFIFSGNIYIFFKPSYIYSVLMSL